MVILLIYLSMDKKVLSEIDIYFGQIEMPEGFEIDREKLCIDILLFKNYNNNFPFSQNTSAL